MLSYRDVVQELHVANGTEAHLALARATNAQSERLEKQGERISLLETENALLKVRKPVRPANYVGVNPNPGNWLAEKHHLSARALRYKCQRDELRQEQVDEIVVARYLLEKAMTKDYIVCTEPPADILSQLVDIDIEYSAFRRYVHEFGRGRVL